MFESALMPIGLTFYLLVALFTTAVAFAPIFSTQRHAAFDKCVRWSFWGFIPLLAVTAYATEQFRYDVQHYASKGDMWMPFMYADIPSEAKDIHYQYHGAAFIASYKIEKQDLMRWIDQTWIDRRSEDQRESADWDTPDMNGGQDFFLYEFNSLGIPKPKSVVRIEGPRKGNGAGFTVYYNEQEQQAFHTASSF